MQNNSIPANIKTLKATIVGQCKITMTNFLTKLRKKMITYVLEANALKQKLHEKLADIKGIDSSIVLLIKLIEKLLDHSSTFIV